jgi:hypothetical protein
VPAAEGVGHRLRRGDTVERGQSAARRVPLISLTTALRTRLHCAAQTRPLRRYFHVWRNPKYSATDLSVVPGIKRMVLISLVSRVSPAHDGALVAHLELAVAGEADRERHPTDE